MILAKRPRSDAEHGRARSHKESKITSDFATSYCYQGPGQLDVFFTNSQVGICSKKFYAQFLGIHRFTTLLSQPALLCRFPELMIWWGGNVPPRGRPSQSLRITEEPPQRALISSTVDDDFSTNILINSSYRSLFDPISILCQEHILSC